MFCTKCGKEIAEGRMFCSSCGAPAPGSQVANTEAPTQTHTAQFAAKKNGISDFFAKCLKSVKNIGVNSNLYVFYIITLVFSWILVNSPLYALSVTAEQFGMKMNMGASFGFGQFGDILSTVGDLGDLGFVSAILIFVAVVINLGLLASIALAFLPIFIGKQTSGAVAVTGMICSIVSVVLFSLLWLLFAILSWVAGSEMGGMGSMYFGPSLSGYWYFFFAIVAIVLSAKVKGALKKKA